MQNGFKKIFLFLVFSLKILCPTTSFAWHDYTDDGDWDYHGSGRDHPYSAYIDRYNYVGYADYAPIEPDYIDGPYYIKDVSPINQFTVNVPNDHGGYTAVVIKKSGNGFIGPQGEFYPVFPKVSQLKMIYGK